jgi:hypothetical protein
VVISSECDFKESFEIILVLVWCGCHQNRIELPGALQGYAAFGLCREKEKNPTRKSIEHSLDSVEDFITSINPHSFASSMPSITITNLSLAGTEGLLERGDVRQIAKISLS